MDASNAGSDEGGDPGGVLVVVAVLSRSSGAGADDVPSVADVESLGSRDAAVGATVEWITEAEDGDDPSGCSGSKPGSSVMGELGTLAVASNDDLGAGALAGGLVDEVEHRRGSSGITALEVSSDSSRVVHALDGNGSGAETAAKSGEQSLAGVAADVSGLCGAPSVDEGDSLASASQLVLSVASQQGFEFASGNSLLEHGVESLWRLRSGSVEVRGQGSHEGKESNQAENDGERSPNFSRGLSTLSSCPRSYCGGWGAGYSQLTRSGQW